MQRRSWVIVLSFCLLVAGCQTQGNYQSKEHAEASKQTDVQEKSQPEVNIVPPDISLQKFDTDHAVSQLKRALNEIGYDLEVNDTFDETLTWAVTDLQLQSDLIASGVYDEVTKEALFVFFEENRTLEAGKGLAAPPEEPEITEAGTEIVSNPYDELALVNKKYALPEDYIPEDLIVPDVPFPFTEDLPKKYLRKNAAHALEDLFAAAEEEGLNMYAQSGYRSYDRQVDVFAANVSQHGEDHANTFSARPGESEHQTGLSMDVTSPEVKFDLITEFGDTEEGKWLAENAKNFGFIIRFPEGKEAITEYQYEPWHIRYVGEKAAQYIAKQDITLEEYVEQFQ